MVAGLDGGPAHAGLRDDPPCPFADPAVRINPILHGLFPSCPRGDGILWYKSLVRGPPAPSSTARSAPSCGWGPARARGGARVLGQGGLAAAAGRLPTSVPRRRRSSLTGRLAPGELDERRTHRGARRSGRDRDGRRLRHRPGLRPEPRAAGHGRGRRRPAPAAAGRHRRRPSSPRVAGHGISLRSRR